MKAWKKLGILWLCLWLFLGLLSPVAMAQEAELDENGYVVWEMNAKGNVLVGNGKYYYNVSPYSTTVGKLEPGLADNYLFANNAIASDGTEYAVYAAAKDGDVLLLYNGGMYLIYATFDGRTSLARLSDGHPDAYTLHSGEGLYDYTLLTDEEGADLLASFEGRTVSYYVADLAERERYPLYGQDQTGMVRYEKGRIYKLKENTYGYVDHTALDNSYFDADGYFSYRSGKVAVTVLDEDATALLEDYLEQVTNHDRPNEFEAFEGVVWAYNDVLPRDVFYSTLIALGILPSIALVVLGSVLGLQRRSRRGRWLVIAAFGVLWLAISVGLLVLCLVLGA